MPEIFLSYRRDDAASAAGRLADRMRERFGGDSIFRDLDSIGAGDDFPDTIREAIRAAAAVLVVIGRRWLDARDAGGGRRLDDPGDYVRLEIETALALGVQIFPVLVEGAQMPREVDLPPTLAPLARRNAWELSERRWSYDAEQLAAQLIESVGLTPTGGPTTDGSRGRHAALTAVTTYVPDLARLLGRPARFIVGRNGGRGVDLVYAFTFFLISFVVGSAWLIAEWPRRGGFFELLFAGVSLWLFVALALSVPLWLAWAILGARRHYQRILVPLLYQLSVLFLGFGIIGTLVLIAIDLRNPATLEKVRDILLRQDALDKRVRDVSALVNTLVTLPEMLAVVPVYLVMAVAATTWLVFAWGAYGRSLGASRLRSFAACLLTIGIVVMLVSVVVWAASL
jgi:hypothetical protein